MKNGTIMATCQSNFLTVWWYDNGIHQQVNYERVSRSSAWVEAYGYANSGLHPPKQVDFEPWKANKFRGKANITVAGLTGNGGIEMKNSIFVGDELPVCGFCGTQYKPSEHDPELGICDCGRMVDVSGFDKDDDSNYDD